MTRPTGTPFWLTSVYKLVDYRACPHVTLAIMKLLAKRSHANKNWYVIPQIQNAMLG